MQSAKDSQNNIHSIISNFARTLKVEDITIEIVDAILNLIRIYISSSKVCAESLSILQDLYQDGENIDFDTIYTLLIEVMQIHQDNHDVQVNAMTSLNHLTKNNDIASMKNEDKFNIVRLTFNNLYYNDLNTLNMCLNIISRVVPFMSVTENAYFGANYYCMDSILRVIEFFQQNMEDNNYFIT